MVEATLANRELVLLPWWTMFLFIVKVASLLLFYLTTYSQSPAPAVREILTGCPKKLATPIFF